ncbi:MAG: hypothetical protein EXR28_11750 [Betaproteobacteria bacterium]|nr:hypothetical protein [Betaproteobacteria bacterium]
MGFLVFAFLLAALIQVPGAWLAPLAFQASNQRLRLADVEGSIWNARAAMHVFDRSSSRWHPGIGIRWRIAWMDLFAGRLAFDLTLDAGGVAQIAAEWRGWSLNRVNARLPVAPLASSMQGALADYGWSGILIASGTAFRCDWVGPISDCTGQLAFDWIDAQSAQIPGPALGDYRLRLTGENQAMHFDLSTQRGRLQIAGAGDYSAGSLRFGGEAWAARDDSAGLDTLLRAIGRPGSKPGRYLIEYRESSGVR